MLHLTAAHDFGGVELIRGEVDVPPVGQPVPVVVAGLRTLDEDLAEDQIPPSRSWTTSAVTPH